VPNRPPTAPTTPGKKNAHVPLKPAPGNRKQKHVVHETTKKAVAERERRHQYATAIAIVWQKRRAYQHRHLVPNVCAAKCIKLIGGEV